jgi:hypothetical protein
VIDKQEWNKRKAGPAASGGRAPGSAECRRCSNRIAPAGARTVPSRPGSPRCWHVETPAGHTRGSMAGQPLELVTCAANEEVGGAIDQ